MEDFDGTNFVINGKTYTFKTDGTSVPALRSFCHNNGIRMEDGKSLQTANKGQLEEAIKKTHRCINAGEEDPWVNKKGSKKTMTMAKPHPSTASVSPMSLMERPYPKSPR
jgi:hypothetical protein